MVVGDRPAELEQLIARRRALGQDRFDEVWEAEYHVAPHSHSDHGIISNELAVALRPYARAAGLIGSDAFSLGEPTDYRVPDGGYHRSRPGTLYVATAAVVVEIVSPDDEAFQKLPFYARRGVEEAIVVLPDEQEIRCYDLRGPEPTMVSASSVLGIGMGELTALVEWPS